MFKAAFLLIVMIRLGTWVQDLFAMEFQTPDGFSITDFSDSWKLLSAFYGRGMPEGIFVERRDFPNGNSKFNCATKSIFINSKVLDPGISKSLAVHEGSHVVLCIATQQFNIDESSRFWDEGLATIFEYRALGREAEYKIRANELAKQQASHNNLVFAKIQKWPSYSRDSAGRINGYAYGVGSSFVYFLVDSYGEAKFKEFISDIGKTKDFADTIKNVFHMSSPQLENQWRNYLEAR